MAVPNPHRSAASETKSATSRVHPVNTGNLILDALPEQEFLSLKRHLLLVPLRAGQILHEAYLPVSFAYFPTGGLVSLRVMSRGGSSTEVAMVGDEGFVGIPLLLETEASAFIASVQMSGSAYRIAAPALKPVLNNCPPLQLYLRRWLQAHITEMALSAACSSVHNIRQRLSCWLLLSSARIHRDRLRITQDMLAQILACRRSSVTTAARYLHAAHVIDYKRGSLTILDRPKLERLACERYRTIQLAFHKILPKMPIFP